MFDSNHVQNDFIYQTGGSMWNQMCSLTLVNYVESNVQLRLRSRKIHKFMTRHQTFLIMLVIKL
jgi:hypothetical protein